MSDRRRRPTLLLAVAVTTATLASPVAAQEDQLAVPSESQLLPGLRNGEHAIARLGDRLPTAAARNDLSPAELVARLRADEDLFVDRTGRLLFVDDGLHAQAPTGDALGGQLATGASIPVSEAFALSSRPGSDRTIHLDFDGVVTTGTVWQGSFPATVGAWDTDGDPTTFSTSERQRIIQVWQLVAEDFAPFDVNVTTVTPDQGALDRSSSGDARYGSSVVFADDLARQTYNCGCGGVAYVGTYDLTGDRNSYYQPAWVFPGSLADSAKNMAEAASHEAGHNLGLIHDGGGGSSYYRGHQGWAPIMGVGYFEPVSQWSKGEYGGATTTQDDLAIITGHGLATIADDHGDGSGSATPLDPAVDEVGVIGTDTDTDWFLVDAGAGDLAVTATVADVGANLDVALTLRDATGAVVATADPTMQRVSSTVAEGLGASLAITLAAGVYTLSVEGVGVRSVDTGYSGYGSLGTYALRGSFVDPSDGGGGGGDPPPVDEPPTAPTDVTASRSGTTVTVRWTDTSADEDGFTVVRERYRRRTWGSRTTVAQVVADVTSVTDSPGRGRYRYRVIATNGAGSAESTWSNSVRIRR